MVHFQTNCIENANIESMQLPDADSIISCQTLRILQTHFKWTHVRNHNIFLLYIGDYQLLRGRMSKVEKSAHEAWKDSHMVVVVPWTDEVLQSLLKLQKHLPIKIAPFFFKYNSWTLKTHRGKVAYKDKKQNLFLPPLAILELAILELALGKEGTWCWNPHYFKRSFLLF